MDEGDVHRGGRCSEASTRSSAPTTATSSGTLLPASWKACISSAAYSSLYAKTASRPSPGQRSASWATESWVYATSTAVTVAVSARSPVAVITKSKRMVVRDCSL